MEAMSHKSSKRAGPRQIAISGRPKYCSRFQRLDNLFSVEPAIFNEYLACVPATNHHTGQMDSRNVAFQRVGVERRLSRFGIEMYAEAFDKRKIGMVAGESEHLAGTQAPLSCSVLNHHVIRLDLHHARFK